MDWASGLSTIDLRTKNRFLYSDDGEGLKGRSPGAVFVQDALQRAHQLLRADAFLTREAVHLLVEVGELHPGQCEVAQLLGQMRQELLQVRGGAVRRRAPHGDHFLQLVLQGRVDGPDGILPAEERLTT